MIYEAPWRCPEHGFQFHLQLCPLCIGDGCEQCDGAGDVLGCDGCFFELDYS